LTLIFFWRRPQRTNTQHKNRTGMAYTGGGRRIWGHEQMVLIRYVLVFSYAWASVGPEGVSDFCFLVDRLLPPFFPVRPSCWI
jgi:hypothetical protein